jgi:regulator of CtrA degradation
MSAKPIVILHANDLAVSKLRSTDFNELYRSVMKFVSDLAVYLDKDGRQESKALPPAAARDYVALTRQLTDGTVRIANALLTLKGVRDGSVSFTSGMADIGKNEMTVSPKGGLVRLDGIPQRLLDLAVQCDALRLEVIRLLDRVGKDGRSGINPVHAALGLIGTAFGHA